MTVSPDDVARRAADVRQRVADAGGSPDQITLVAVTKGFPASVAVAAATAGMVDLGENYAQELVAKAVEMVDLFPVPPVRWHWIGRLQSNKVRALAPVVHLWQTVDRPALIHEIARRAPGAAVLIQVNVSDEPAKGGCAPSDTAELVAQARDHGLAVRCLMTFGRTGPPAEARAGFEDLARLADRLDLQERSMGMSADLEVAVQAGSTMIRVGGALFGPRPARPLPGSDPANR